jgi:hypothetical protein
MLWSVILSSLVSQFLSTSVSYASGSSGT